jgi:hypothetical protein
VLPAEGEHLVDRAALGSAIIQAAERWPRWETYERIVRVRLAAVVRGDAGSTVDASAV